MLRTDECALICDLAEVYHIYDYRSLPARRVATFAVGLRKDSRIKTKMRGDDLKGNDLTDILIANLFDLIYAFIMRGKSSFSMVGALLDELYQATAEEQGTGQYRSFNNADEYESERRKIIGG